MSNSDKFFRTVEWLEKLPGDPLSLALTIASKVHAQQFDKAGAPYILHPLRVMAAQESEEARCVAILHDVCEDSDMVPLEVMRDFFSAEIVDALDSVTRRKDETYETYLERVAANPIGRQVKIADLLDNARLGRFENPTEKDKERCEKYLVHAGVLAAQQPRNRELSIGDELSFVSMEIAALECRKRALYAESLDAPESQKACSDLVAGMLSEHVPERESQLPRTVQHMLWDDKTKVFESRPMFLVRVRVASEDTTHLGIMIGDLATSVTARYNADDQVLSLGPCRLNPAILVPALGRIVFGRESWWGRIKTAEELTAITDATIANVPYVKMLSELVGLKSESE